LGSHEKQEWQLIQVSREVDNLHGWTFPALHAVLRSVLFVQGTLAGVKRLHDCKGHGVPVISIPSVKRSIVCSNVRRRIPVRRLMWCGAGIPVRSLVSLIKTGQTGGFAMTFRRITVNPEICGGRPVVRGLRFPVSRLLGLLAAGETTESIVKAYPYLEPEDVREALSYAALLADEEVVEFAS
jgi:uncharacterized protein (DUF433 family)